MLNKGWGGGNNGENGQKYKRRGTNKVRGESPGDLKGFKVEEESIVQKENAPKVSSVECLILKSC